MHVCQERFYVAVFWILQICVAISGTLRIALGSTLAPTIPSLKVGICIAKTGAALINFNAALLLLSMTRNLWTRISMLKLFRWLPMRFLAPLHRWAGILFLLGAIVHCLAHMANLIIMARHRSINMGHPTLILGFLLLGIYVSIGLTAFSKLVREKCFEVFIYLHYLAPLSMPILWLHGIFCFLKDSAGVCAGSTTLYWIAGPTALYLANSVFSSWNARRFAYICKIIKQPSDVLEVHIRKPHFVFLPGQFVCINLPDVSRFQWHPFTLTSAPEEDHISIHIRISGDWTSAVCEYLQSAPLDRTRIYIDGPLGCACQEHQNYEMIVCIGAGIGQTPFASILKSLWFRLNKPLPRGGLCEIHFVGICRSTKSLEWFNDILSALERSNESGILKLHLYVTGKVTEEEQALIAAHHDLGLNDPVTGLKSPTHYGRPEFGSLFNHWAQLGRRTIGVFYCGPPVLGKKIQRISKSTSDGNTLFVYHEETFY